MIYFRVMTPVLSALPLCAMVLALAGCATSDEVVHSDPRERSLWRDSHMDKWNDVDQPTGISGSGWRPGDAGIGPIQ